MTTKIDMLSRIGYAARAVVYALIGFFGVLVALGMGGRLMDTHLALREMLSKPFGSLFLIVLGLGLFAYSFWRFFQAWKDPDGFGSDGKGLVVRATYVFGGLLHAMLGFSAINLIFRLAQTSGSENGEKRFAGMILSQNFGAWLLGAVAIGIFVFAAVTIYRAVTEKFAPYLSLPRKHHWLLSVCKAGLISRGLVFAIIGWLFLRAGLHANSSEASGLRGVWNFLGNMPFGTLLIAVLSIGFLAFSVYGFTEAIYRKPLKS